MRIFNHPNSRTPQINVLSNGRYQVVISNAGGGYSRWRDLALTRWREDTTTDSWGTFIYVREPEEEEIWSAAYRPTNSPSEEYKVTFIPGGTKFSQRRNRIEIETEICVSQSDDVELRRVTLTNKSDGRRTIQLTSYAEIVLANAGADAAHPVFSNLFVQTEFLKSESAILCNRRPRSKGEPAPWLAHFIVGDTGAVDELTCETDRARFLGRGRSTANPVAMDLGSLLSNTAGSVLDPIVSLRRTFQISPGQSVDVAFFIGAADTREMALALVEKYRAPGAVDECLNQTATRRMSSLTGFTEEELDLYNELAGALVYADPMRRAAPEVLAKNRLGQSGLWRFAVSGDIPVVVLAVGDLAKIGVVEKLVRAHAYWRAVGLNTDLVVFAGSGSDLFPSLKDQVVNLVKAGSFGEIMNKSGGIFVLDSANVSEQELALFQSVARIFLTDESELPPTLSDTADDSSRFGPALSPVRGHLAGKPAHTDARELQFGNGVGGFSRDGNEYVITLYPEQETPAPWVNVIANASFGTLISESGSGYTWAENSHEYRLTPWNNDPVTDSAAEYFYLRDEETGRFWSPTPLPVRGQSAYLIRHGFGYSIFEHEEDGIVSECAVFVAAESPVKCIHLALRNVSARSRTISITGYWEWVLGDLRQRHRLFVETAQDSATGALLAWNRYNADFSNRIVFIDVDDSGASYTGDREEFLGRNGSVSSPAAMSRVRLSGTVGAGLDPCGAVRTVYALLPGEEREVAFRVGVGQNLEQVQGLVRRFRGPETVRSELGEVRARWKRTMSAVRVETPDPSVDLMVNGWLLYQVLSCRLWGRTGFYQSGGAFGFRDQLQDAMALVHAEPDLVRGHLMRAAARQFREGDVQHWWHPPSGRGVRTHVSDDFLWLPYVTCRYVQCTGDVAILDEKVPFLEGRTLGPEEESWYDMPRSSDESATLYEHCVRAVEHGLRFGEHGLPLMGGGDWNDGMNLVGREGKGESVWLAFFLCDVLQKFADLARSRQDKDFADRCLLEAKRVQTNIDLHAWDGRWYRRAYFDNGEPLGSHLNSECQIDSISQSWSVLSGAGDPQRSRWAMQSVAERLVRADASLIQLLDPPFDRTSLDPGYIKGYVPGVRENGGQYTHAAVWATMAFAVLGDHEKAWELARLLNPVHHGSRQDKVQVYKVEPYVIAADIYAIPPHTGRGGWTWYTGSAGWMYRLLTETLLGLNVEGNRLRLEPRLPDAWTTCQIEYRYHQTLYRIAISRGATSKGGIQISLDGTPTREESIPLVDDCRNHEVVVRLPAVSAG